MNGTQQPNLTLDEPEADEAKQVSKCYIIANYIDIGCTQHEH